VKQSGLPESLKSVQVLVRFLLRTLILLTFATFAGISFARSMVALLWMAAVLCAAVAALRRELPFRGELNHWDEMASYIALSSLASRFAVSDPA
jgi:hypothetical protein